MALRGSQGTSDFGQLFLGLSMFLVFAGAALAAMLLKLSVEQRSAESGILGACGVSPKIVRTALIAEGIVLTVLGVAFGVPAGAWYAGALIQGLSNWWSGALGATQTVWLHLVPGSLVAGGVTGLVGGAGTAVGR
jgi:ABC-type antimicrobial peptide transport system permease subunit